MNKRFVRGAACLLALLLFTGRAWSQSLSDTLKQVEVTDQRSAGKDMQSRYAPGQKVVTIDSQILQQYQQQSLATLLSQQIPVFVKSYGFNNLATLNFRGSSAAQSQVLWEGIPLQNAASGIADVSLLPVMLADKVSIVYGSSAALWGSGNVGGALMLESRRPAFDTSGLGLTVFAGVGSFHQYQAGVKGAWRARKWEISLKAFGQEAKNDFTYKDQYGERVTMTNARLRSGSILSRVAWQPDVRNLLTLQAWLQQYDRQIPPALFERFSIKEQQDAAARFLFHWKHQGRQTYYVKAAYLRDRLAYKDSTVEIDANVVTDHYYAEVGWETVLFHHKLLVFAPVQLFAFNSDPRREQFRAALAGAYQLRFKRLQVALNARAEAIDEKGIFLPGVNAAWRPTSWLTLKANVQRTYRTPTLNELYYNPGGNTQLKPEEGWHMDAGYSISRRLGDRVQLEHGISGFNRYIDNWIIWYGGAIWTPHNIAAVHSRGLETDNRLNIRTGAVQWHLAVNAAYTRATTTKSVIANDNSIGKQIPYAPRISVQGNAGLTWRSWYLNYNHTYTGTRYITTDESQELDPYQTGNIQLSYGTTLRRYALKVQVQCQNIGDQEYAVVGFRSMPGINWLAGLSIGVNN